MDEIKENLLCRHFTTVVVLGLGGVTEKIGRADARALRETIFGLDYESWRLKIFANVSTVLDEFNNTRDQNLLQEICDEVLSISRTSSCDKVSLVIFGHSHGAKMVQEALSSIRNKTPPEYYDALAKKIAVVTLGGVTFINPIMAKVVLNVESVNDLHAKAAVKAGLGTHDEESMTVGPFKNSRCMCCLPKDQMPLEEPKATTSNAGNNFGLRQMLHFGAQFLHSAKVTGHYLSDYVLCKKWRKDLQYRLGVGKQGTCSCSEEPPYQNDGEQTVETKY